MRGPFEFEWIDAYSPEDRWYYDGEFVLEPRVMRTIGWVVHQGGGYIVIASTYDESGGFFAQLIAIPISLFTRPPRDVSEHNVEHNHDPSDLDGDRGDDTFDRDSPGPLEGLGSLGSLHHAGDGGDECASSSGCVLGSESDIERSGAEFRIQRPVQSKER